ncbi:MAG TPA: GTPase, partial [Cyanobacteria bacterium UBA11162]|nr:GTPase [Cyanobacteria bacterium UBA11162]
LIPELETPKKKFDASVQTLNLAYAKRIVDWCLENYEPLTEQNIHKTITKVERNFGSRMTIETKFAIQSRMSTQQINQILQEDVSIQRIQ